ncbi:MAG: tetratricopeptide repeat protein [Acidobacteriota bacterium]
MIHPSTDRLHAFLSDLSLQDVALLSHLLRCSKCSLWAAVRVGVAPNEVRDLKAEEPPPSAGENYPGLFDRLERTVGGARQTFTRDRIAADLLLGELLLPTSKVERIERLYAEPRFHQLALAELLLARSPYDPAERRDLIQLASAILDLVPEGRDSRGRRASLRAAAYISLGETLREMGDFAGAEAALLFAPEWVEHTGDVLDAADFCRTLGRLRQGQKRRDEAIALLGRAADLYEEISQSDAEARIRVELGELCLEGAEPGRALDEFLGALRFGPVELTTGLAVRAASGAAESWLLLEGPEAALGSVAGIRETFGWQADSGPDLALRDVEARLLFEAGEIAGTTQAPNESLDGRRIRRKRPGEEES